MKKAYLIVFMLIAVVYGCSKSMEDLVIESKSVMSGADVLVTEKMYLLEGKNIGIVTNHTAILSNGTYLVDTLHQLGVNIIALFGPEHGVRGDAPAGKKIDDDVDPVTQIPVYSLYGETRKPNDRMMKGIDLLIFDIQDVGARFYTYISTLFYILQAGVEFNVPVIVLDRPNPIGGLKVDGPIRKENQHSFVGIAPIPIMHGLTIGELAKLFVEENYIKTATRPELIIIEMKNWKRDFYFDETGLPWVDPSPNINSLETAIVYPGTCFIEGTNLSEGRGTYEPFLTLGAPFIKADLFINELLKSGTNGLSIEPFYFQPGDIPNMATNPKHKDEICYGIRLTVIDRQKFEPVQFGIKIIYAVYKLFPEELQFRESFFNRLLGDESILQKIKDGITPAEIISSWQDELSEFKSIREKYLLY